MNEVLPVGLWLFPKGPLVDVVQAIVDAESCGFGEVWIGDEGPAGWDPFVVLAAAAVRTKSISLGIGVANPVTRHPGASALAAMSLHELSGGRCRLGLGVGGGFPLNPFGLQPGAPLASVTKAVETVRAVATGRTTDSYAPMDGANTSPELEIWVGSRGPKINRMAAELADGVFLSGISAEELPTVAGWVHERRGERKVGIATYLTACLDPSVGSLFDAARTASTLHGPPDVIAAHLRAVVSATQATSCGLALISNNVRADVVAAAEVLASLRGR